MITLTLYLRNPITGNTIKDDDTVPFTISEISCEAREYDDPEEAPQTIAAAHKGYVDAAGQPVPIAELRRWRLKEGLMNAYRDKVYFLPFGKQMEGNT